MVRRLRIPIDLALLGALLAGGIVEALSDSTLTGNDQLVAVVGASAAVGALTFRRRAPEASFAVLTAIVALWIALAYGWSEGPFFGFVDMLVGAFALGLHGRGRRAAIVFAAVLALVVIHDVYAWARGFIAAGDTAPAWIFLATAFGAGVVAQRWAERAEREHELHAREAVADERTRIARELHDVVAHDVSVMVVQAQGAARVLEGDQPEVRAALEAIERTGRGAVDEMRRLLGVLRRSDEEIALAPQPSLGELEALVTHVRAAGLPVALEVVGTPVALPPGIDLSAYRIVQEALTNALKHAGPARARVVVRYGPDAVELEVSDDGAGVVDGPGTGHGLVGMRERVALYGGELQAGRSGEGGWALRARLPLGAA